MNEDGAIELGHANLRRSGHFANNHRFHPLVGFLVYGHSVVPIQISVGSNFEWTCWAMNEAKKGGMEGTVWAAAEM